MDWEKDIGGGTPGYVVSGVTTTEGKLLAEVDPLFVAHGQTRRDERRALGAALRRYWRRQQEYAQAHGLPTRS